MSITPIDFSNFSSGRRGGAAVDGLSPIEEVLEDFRAGKMVILVDDEDRENEGDLVMAADSITPEDINFMASHGRGLICLTLTHDRCEQLGLGLMTRNNNERYSTNFTVSIEAAEGVTTGISARDRATTIQAAVREGATARDIVTPGHIFPVMALAGGVLTRAGHTEAGVDMARISGKTDASVICEILNEDGTMARLPDLVEFAKAHDLKIGTIEDLIRYRLEKEPTVHRLEQHRLATDDGDLRVVAYQDVVDNSIHLAFVHGELDARQPVPVRVQLERGLYDVVDGLDGASNWSTELALEHIRKAGAGVVVVLQYPQSPVHVIDRVRELSRLNDSSAETDRDGAQAEHLRVLGLGSQILADLGVRRMTVLGSPVITHGLAAFGLNIDQYVTSPGREPQPAASAQNP